MQPPPSQPADLEALLEAFEDAHRRGARPDVADFLPPAGGPQRAAALRELVRLDLEFRWAAGEPLRLDDYCRRFPELDALATLCSLPSSPPFYSPPSSSSYPYPSCPFLFARLPSPSLLDAIESRSVLTKAVYECWGHGSSLSETVSQVRSYVQQHAERLDATVRTAVTFLDRVVDINFYPTEQAGTSNSRWRPVGLGLMGLQDVLFRLRLPFDSAEARELSTRISERIMLAA